MIQRQFTIENQRGLHTRTCAKLVDLAKRFPCHLSLTFQDQHADCKNIMALMTLGVQKNHTVTLTAEGADEEAAMNAIANLINTKFGED